MSRLALLLAASVAAPGAARGDGGAAILLGVLEVERAPGLDLDAPLRATLELNPSGAEKVESLRAWFPAARVAPGSVTVELAGRAPVARGRPGAPQRGPTFLVDYDRSEAAAFREAVAALGPRPGDAALAELVDGWITRKSLGRAFDSAAEVASRREGDCTEHAVLLAAAARIAGHPARVVIGVALVPIEGELRAFGHAWTELHDARGWRTLDATRLPPAIRYLPLAALVDEGPGYLMSAWSALSPIDVRRIALSRAPAR